MSINNSSESSREKFVNLASKTHNNGPSTIQAVKEYIASLLGIKITDEKFLKKLQETHDNIINTVSK